MLDLTTKTQTASCGCPACMGLACLERPRFFTGQLLTEAELNGEQAYVLAKNRLHNRYLHGCGVVCGLEVVCNPCPGYVTVKQGYAIDCCGNDIVVCADADFNVLDAIRHCQDSRRRVNRSGCDPISPPVDPGCAGETQEWCITLEYVETEARPQMSLRRASSSKCSCNGNCKGSCGCGSGGGCGCGNGATNGATKGASYGGTNTWTQVGSAGSGGGAVATLTRTSATTSNVTQCEPTRIVEGYRLSVVEAPPGLCGNPRSILDGTLLQKLLGCFHSLSSFMTSQASSNTLKMAGASFFGSQSGYPEPQAQYDAYCQYRQAVTNLYLQNPLMVRCGVPAALGQITLSPPAQGIAAEEYAGTVRAQMNHLSTLVAEYGRDCVCEAMLPSCAPDPTDDRLILACVTVQDGTIVRICDFACRRYAGSFPAIKYWLSILPIVPLISYLVARFCCGDDLLRMGRAMPNRLMNMVETFDPAGRIRASLYEGDFAMPRFYMQSIGALKQQATLARVGEVLTPAPTAVNLTTLVNQPRTDVLKTLVESGVTHVEVPIAAGSDVPIARAFTASPIVGSGDHVAVYTSGGKVVGYGPYDAGLHLQQVTALKDRLAGLEKTVAKLQKKSQR